MFADSLVRIFIIFSIPYFYGFLVVPAGVCGVVILGGFFRESTYFISSEFAGAIERAFVAYESELETRVIRIESGCCLVSFQRFAVSILYSRSGQSLIYRTQCLEIKIIFRIVGYGR